MECRCDFGGGKNSRLHKVYYRVDLNRVRGEGGGKRNLTAGEPGPPHEHQHALQQHHQHAPTASTAPASHAMDGSGSNTTARPSRYFTGALMGRGPRHRTY